MRRWDSRRSRSQRKLISSLKIPASLTDYYRSTHGIRPAPVYFNLEALYIAFLHIVGANVGMTQKAPNEALSATALRQARPQDRERKEVRIAETEFCSCLFSGGLLITAI